MCFFSCASRFVFFIYGTLGPAYQTYKTLNNGDDEFLAWAKYWIVYAFLVSGELLTDTFFSWMTIYMPIKLVLMLLIVLTAPTANVWMFDAIVHPILAKHQEEIDQFLQRGKYKAMNDLVKTVSLMCIHGRTFTVPFISHLWSRSNLITRVPDNLEAVADANNGKAENEQDSDASSSSMQTSRLNASITRYRPVNEQSENMLEEKQSVLHTDRSLNDLVENTISPESSTSVRRQVPRKPKIHKVPRKEAVAPFPSKTSLTMKKAYDEVEDLLASSTIESDGQSFRPHRPVANRIRPVTNQP